MDTPTLSLCQGNGLNDFMNFMESDETYFVLTGGPGRGKSFLTKYLAEQVMDKYPKMPIYSTATTNKAAAVLEDNIELNSDTVYKLFGLKLTNNIKTGAQYISKTPKTDVIHNALIIIDEISMAEDDLLNIIEEHTINCKVLFVGDEDQLAPVFSTKCPAFHKGHRAFELKTVMRQKEGSQIIALSDQLRNTVRTGEFKPIDVFARDKEISFVTGAEFQERVDHDFVVNHGRLDHGKIICWTNDQVNAYNAHVRALLTDSTIFEVDEVVVTNVPIFDGAAALYNTDQYAMVTDVAEGNERDIAGHWFTLDNRVRVFQAANQQEVKNYLNALANRAKAREGSWVDFFRAKEFFADLRSIHACTAYKSQGSTYDTAYIDLNDIGRCRQWAQVARMLYVGSTRARKEIVFYGALPFKYQSGSMA